MISSENLIPERCPSRSFEIYLLIPSITSKNNKGERRKPCLQPLELLKKDVGEPLIKTAKLAEEMQAIIQLITCSVIPI